MTPRLVCTVVAALSALLAVGCAALAIAHAGIEVPVLSSIGPGGDDPVVPAAIAFTVATIVLAAAAIGVRRMRPWGWALGVVVHSLVFLGAAMPYRGIASLLAIIVSGVCIGLLLTPAARRALLAR